MVMYYRALLFWKQINRGCRQRICSHTKLWEACEAVFDPVKHGDVELRFTMSIIEDSYI